VDKSGLVFSVRSKDLLFSFLFQELAINAIFQLLEYEGRGYQRVWSAYHFPNAVLHSLMMVLLESEGEQTGLISTCHSWLRHHDVLYHWLRNIA